MMAKNNNKWLFWLTALACILALTVFSLLLFQSSQSTKLAKASGYSSDQIVVAVNQERIKNNLQPLLTNAQLNTAAAAKVKDMAGKNYFSHISPVDGRKWSSFIKESGYVYVEAGENLANGYDSVESMVKAWMNSPTHRDNILNSNFVETGMGMEYGTLNDYPTIFVAQAFGKRDIPEVAEKAKVEVAENQNQASQPTEKKAEEPLKIEPQKNVDLPKSATSNDNEKVLPVTNTNVTKYDKSSTLAEIVAPFPILKSSN